MLQGIGLLWESSTDTEIADTEIADTEIADTEMASTQPEHRAQINSVS